MNIPPLQCVTCWIALLLSLLVQSGHGIGCFLCNSLNNSNVGCHDPFHPAYNTYQENCKQGKFGIKGLFPAAFCVKIIGWRMRDNAHLIIRRCTLARFTETDHKLGLFKWEDEIYQGIVSTCKSDGCNAANHGQHVPMTTIVAMVTFVTLLLWRC